MTDKAEEPPQEFTRYPRADIEDLVKNKFKTFCKEKCAECGKPATKRFNSMMSVLVVHMIDSFWCRDCGRVLCESHRHQHTCELIDQQKERNKNITHEQLAAQIAEVEARKEAKEEEERLEARRIAEEEEQQRLVRKGRRELLAKKAKTVEDFLQSILRDPDGPSGRPGATRDELFEMHPRAQGLALRLYSEFLHPGSKELPEEDWASVKEIYKRAQELTGRFVMTEDGPLNLRNSWDPPPEEGEGDEQNTDGAGLGRGLL
mmetsp:Transcript_19586/g.29304  ORF Transcript_19586/g.29304 Transcript_19586/m.29304 type:complete len:261 (-) Transcript_19586:89-871(-)|eukprot:CAMPEP_0206452132 /NCGR_PEP_ID=MMETSP0324_2-20121206/19765_1 /ASSEMBLY_ACC=CAM_ASM_000836 /TAXON_ID=2866 /ORGANISM="Crypthecodinium cohnii, Strain Seligo" /LENGTH=260 /DNA_ID=CAMNT_0053922167 /DNA_START=220 /DNA_END=1002 /DNA_ORIENTATION=-